jgi:hypothetical protein
LDISINQWEDRPFLSIHKRTKKGYPLSPLLYVLVLEPFNKQLELERLNGTITGLCTDRGVKRINHSQFLDDTLLLGGASRIIETWFKLVLDQFTHISGGIINENKIQIYALNIDARSLMDLDQIISFPIS